MLLCDTGVLLAAGNMKDHRHAACLAMMRVAERKEFVRTVFAAGFPRPGGHGRVPVSSRRAAPARTTPAAPRRPDAAHPPEAATLPLIHARCMNQW